MVVSIVVVGFVVSIVVVIRYEVGGNSNETEPRGIGAARNGTIAVPRKEKKP